MSDKRERKPRVIHVDKLIVKADEVIILPEENKKRRHRDPWGFPIREEKEELKEEQIEVTEDIKDEDVVEDVDVDVDKVRKRGPRFPW